MFGVCNIYMTPCEPLISHNWLMLLAANSLLHIKITRLGGLISLQVRCKARKETVAPANAVKAYGTVEVQGGLIMTGTNCDLFTHK